MPVGQVRGLLDKGSKPLRAIRVAAPGHPRSLTRRSAPPHPSAAAQLPPSPSRGEGVGGYDTRAKKLLKGELKQQGITYAGRLLQWLVSTGASCLRLQD